MLLAIPALAADRWTRIVTPEFELYTTAGEKHGRETIRHFEQVREFFVKASPVRGPADFPVRIVEFETAQQYEPFRPNAFTTAYFIAAPERDYIVMGDVASRNYPIAIHEYMHLIIRHSGLKLPLWLNEGWADVYSTLRPMGKETAVGDLLADRMNILMREPWLSFEELTAVNTRSPAYHEESRVGIFYAESWALAHMLYLAPEYRDNFGKFVMALNRGSSAAEACRIAFGRTADAVFKDLHSYLDRKRIYGRVFETGMDDSEAGTESAVLSGFDSRLMLADLMAVTGKRAEAKLEYASLEKEQPERPDLAQAIGSLALAMDDRETARRYFEKAFDGGGADPRMCLQLAMLERLANRPPGMAIPILERALKSKPGYTDASIQLGLARVEARDFPAAIATLMAIPNVTPDRAPPVFCALSYAYIETGDVASGRQNAETCGKWAKTDEDVNRAAALRKLAEARAQPDAAVHQGEVLQSAAGLTRNIECSPEGNRLQIAAGDKLMTFDLPAPDAIETSGSGHLTCGPQQPVRVGVEYAPPPSAVETSAGIVRRLVF